MLLIRLMGLKTLILIAPHFVGISEINEKPICLDRQPLVWNSVVKSMILSSITSQNLWNKARGKSSGPGAISPSESKTAAFTSPTWKFLSNQSASCCLRQLSNWRQLLSTCQLELFREKMFRRLPTTWLLCLLNLETGVLYSLDPSPSTNFQ